MIFINKFLKSDMNYNISDFVNRSYILNQTGQNKSKQTQILLLCTLFLKFSHFNSFETIACSLRSSVEIFSNQQNFIKLEALNYNRRAQLKISRREKSVREAFEQRAIK